MTDPALARLVRRRMTLDAVGKALRVAADDLDHIERFADAAAVRDVVEHLAQPGPTTQPTAAEMADS
jgi:hypothetical protein